MSGFEWTAKKEKAAFSLAEGMTEAEAADIAGVSDRTVRRWKTEPEFSAEVDRLTLMVGIAGRAERLRIAKRLIRQRIMEDKVLSEKDILDWLKFAQSETDGIKLDLATLIEASTSLAD